MIPKSALIAFFVALCASVARADVTPTEPGPGAIFKAGGPCHIAWNGDTNSTTAWKKMSIELMTGSNFQMIHLTTVASNLDGTVSGVFDYTCPQVSPNSAIYFYQFTAPGTSNRQWTTRFTIASGSGQTTPPSEQTQPGTGASIPWGTGKLVDASSASPPPAYISDGGGSMTSVPANSTSPTSSLVSTSVASLSTTSSSDATPVTSSSSDTSPVASLASSAPAVAGSQTSPSTPTGSRGTGTVAATGTGTGTASNGASAVGHSIAAVMLAASAFICIVSF